MMVNKQIIGIVLNLTKFGISLHSIPILIFNKLGNVLFIDKTIFNFIQP